MTAVDERYSVARAGESGRNSLTGEPISERAAPLRYVVGRTVLDRVTDDRAAVPQEDPPHVRYDTPDRLRALAEAVGPAGVEVFGEQRVLVVRPTAALLAHCPDPFGNLVAVVDLPPAPGEGG